MRDAPDHVKRPRGHSADEQAVVGIDIGWSHSGVDSGVPNHGHNVPIEGVTP